MSLYQIDEDVTYRVKIIVVGDAGVGKTSIVKRICNKTLSKKPIPTLGAEFSSVVYQTPQRKVHISLWDTTGQEKYRSLTSQHYRNVNGAIIVYDVNDKKSFLNCSKWLTDVVQNSPQDVSLLMLGNKIDRCQFRSSEVGLQAQFVDSVRQVQTQEAQKFAVSNNMSFGQVSAVTGFKVQAIVNAFIEKVAGKMGFEQEQHSQLLLSVPPTKSPSCCRC